MFRHMSNRSVCLTPLYYDRQGCIQFSLTACNVFFREAAKNSYFLSCPANKAFSPLPPFSFTLKKGLYSLAPPPLSSGLATKKRTFFAVSLTIFTRYSSIQDAIAQNSRPFWYPILKNSCIQADIRYQTTFFGRIFGIRYPVQTYIIHF